MAKEKVEDGKEKKVLTPNEVLSSILKETKEDHYNFEPDHDYKVPCSSLQLTAALDGGLTPGAHRFIGITSGGKSSCALDFMYHFLKDKTKKRRGIYIKAEGRLSTPVKLRSGITYNSNKDTWADGECFIYESNIYEAVFKLKREMLEIEGYEFFFITDSVDNLIKREDAKKPEELAITVGGGSLITSVFLKKVGLAMAKRGHIDLYISQVREQIKVNQYEVTVPKQGKSSGARSLEHQANVVLDFLARYGGDLILEGDKGSKILGHFCKCKILKSDNEKNMVDIKYAIRYGQTAAKSVWLTYELSEILRAWHLIKRQSEKGSIYVLDTVFRAEMIEALGKDIPEQIKGVDNIIVWLEENEDIQQYLFNKLIGILS